MTDARRHLDVAAQSADEAVKRDRYTQAAQRLGYAATVLRGLAPETAGPGGWGASLSLPGAAPLVFGPGPR